MMYKDLTVVLGLWDTGKKKKEKKLKNNFFFQIAGQQDYETLRPLAFPGTVNLYNFN